MTPRELATASDPGMQTCPYCGEQVEVDVEMGAGPDEYVEDCPICCRPWTVRWSGEEGNRRVYLLRSDE